MLSRSDPFRRQSISLE